MMAGMSQSTPLGTKWADQQGNFTIIKAQEQILDNTDITSICWLPLRVIATLHVSCM